MLDLYMTVFSVLCVVHLTGDKSVFNWFYKKTKQYFILSYIHICGIFAAKHDVLWTSLVKANEWRFIFCCSFCWSHLCSSRCPGWPHSAAEPWMSSQPWCWYPDPGSISQAEQHRNKLLFIRPVHDGVKNCVSVRLTVSPGRGLSLPPSAEALASWISFSRPRTIDRAFSISNGPHASWACTHTHVG